MRATIKTKSMTIATRQKRQLSPLPHHLVLRGAKIEQVSEHCLLGITIDNKLRWDSHTNTVCKTVSRRVFRLSKLMYIVDIDTRKLFSNAHIKTHIDYAPVVWERCSDMSSKTKRKQKQKLKMGVGCRIKVSAQKSCQVNLSRHNSNY